MVRGYEDYSLDGLILLGEAVRYWREAPKPHWEPVVQLHPEDLALEKGRWTQVQMAAIINREYGLRRGDSINGERLSRLEKPASSRSEPPLRLLELIIGLNIMLNPKTKAPFTLAELLDIAKCRLDWRTGEPIQSCHEAHG